MLEIPIPYRRLAPLWALTCILLLLVSEGPNPDPCAWKFYQNYQYFLRDQLHQNLLRYCLHPGSLGPAIDLLH